MTFPERDNVRLESWKEIATFFGRDERTVRRWEAERGLPIRRLPGGVRSRIFAHVADLEAWRAGVGPDTPESSASSAPPVHDPAPVAPTKRISWRVVALASVAALVALAGIGLVSASILSRGPAEHPRKPPPLAAQALYLAGMNDWAHRTPAGLNQALEEFNGAIRLDPDYAEAYVGLANTFNLLREFTLMPASQAYPLARSAALRAVALDDNLAEAHAALAFADFWGFWDAAAARREYKRALALDPASVTARHWYATFLMEQGDGHGALREIDRAQALDPASLSIAADRGAVLLSVGRRAEGTAVLQAEEAAHPEFLSPHRYLAGAYLSSGRNEDFLRETQAVASLTGDRSGVAAAAAAERGLVHGGRREMLEVMLSDRIEQSKAGAVSAYSVAQLYGLLGDQARAAAWLRLSLAKHEGDLLSLRSDRAFERSTADPVLRAVDAEAKSD